MQVHHTSTELHEGGDPLLLSFLQVLVNLRCKSRLYALHGSQDTITFFPFMRAYLQETNFLKYNQ